MTVISVVIGAPKTVFKGLVKGTGRLGHQRTCRHYPDYVIKFDQNTEKSPGDLRRLAVIPTLVTDHQLTLE